jgi:signal peptidase I
MAGLPMDSGQPNSVPLPGAASNPSYRWKKATLAGILGLFFAGMGQLYNRQPRKAFGMALFSQILGMLMVKTRFLLAFSTMVATVVILLVWKLFVAAEAAYTAAKAKKPEPSVPLPWLTYPLLAVLFFAAAFFLFPDQLKKDAGFSAFKVPSASMCPTICLGERFVADIHAYKSKLPQRGDLILMKHASSGALFIKRVIGIGGDTVAPGQSGTILVNGQPSSPPDPAVTPLGRKGLRPTTPCSSRQRCQKDRSSSLEIILPTASTAALPISVQSRRTWCAENHSSFIGPLVLLESGAPSGKYSSDPRLRSDGTRLVRVWRRTCTDALTRERESVSSGRGIPEAFRHGPVNPCRVSCPEGFGFCRATSPSKT